MSRYVLFDRYMADWSIDGFHWRALEDFRRGHGIDRAALPREHPTADAVHEDEMDALLAAFRARKNMGMPP